MTKQYNNYKPSGVEWLDQIPFKWKEERIKKYFRSISKRGDENCELLSSSQKFGVIPVLMMENRVTSATKNIENMKLVLPYNFVISLRSFQGGIEHSIYKGVISPSYTVFEKSNNKNNTGYFKYLFKSPLFIKYLGKFKKSIRDGQTIDYNLLNRDLIAIPSESEQSLIANYLDEKTSSIDNSIETLKLQKERLIEQKKAIIHKAVTKGLDDSVEMKDSGVEWIGEIPKHWNITRLQNKLKNNIVTGKCDVNEEDYNGKYDFFTCSVNSKKINKYSFDTEALLVAGNGEVGHVQYFKGKFEAYQRTYVITGFYDYSPFFIKYLIESLLKEELNRIKKGGVIEFIKLSNLTNFKIPSINKEEQIKIANYLDEKTSKIEEAVNEVEKQINLLEEYKKTLINDVVTGKIKVF